MFAAKMPREIKNYKEKIVLNLTVRQLICVVVALAIGIPVYFFGRNLISSELLSWIVIIIGLFFGGIGFVRVEEKTLEVYLLNMLKYTFLYPQRRKYRSASLMERYMEEEYWKTYDQFIVLNRRKKH